MATPANMATIGYKRDECSNCGAKQSTTGTPLLTCARCSTRKYCSRACQVERWPFHKSFCATRPRHKLELHPNQVLGYGILNVPDMPNEVCINCMVTPPPGMVEAKTWTEIPFSAAVGMPMRVAPALDNGPQRFIVNETINGLGIDIYPTSTTFGEINWGLGRQPMGECLLTRVDGGEFHMTHAMALYHYAHQGIGAIKAATKQEAAGKSVDRQALVAKYLSPKGFKMFFEEMRAADNYIEAAAWEGVECPVDVV